MGVTVLDIDRLIETYEANCEVFDFEVVDLIEAYRAKKITTEGVDRLAAELVAFFHTEFEMEP